MALEILISSIADAVFAILINDFFKRKDFSTFREKIHGESLEKAAFQRALAKTYLVFEQKYPDLVASFFDEKFLMNNYVVKELTKTLIPNQDPNAIEISNIWNSQINRNHNIDISIQASYFIEKLHDFINEEPDLKPFIDSRAFEQLYSISINAKKQLVIQQKIKDILSDIQKLLIKQDKDETSSCSNGLINAQKKGNEKFISTIESHFERRQVVYAALTKLNNELTSFLCSMSVLDTISKRSALLFRVGFDAGLLHQIEYDGSTILFISNVIDNCESFGQLSDGRDALEAFLNTIKSLVGIDKQKVLEGFLIEWESLRENLKEASLFIANSHDEGKIDSLYKKKELDQGIKVGSDIEKLFPVCDVINNKVNNLTTKSILIVAVTKVEVQSILEIFSKGNNWIRNIAGNKIYYNLGDHGGAPVFMAQSEMGTSVPGGSLLTIRQAIKDIKPQAVISYGLAFGLQPEKEKLGDILISKQIKHYEPAKIDFTKGNLPRGDCVTASTWLLDKFRSGDIDWHGAKTHFGLILSGEKLVNHKDFRDWLLKSESEAIGGEMEGAGLYTAARDTKTDWILVKAICDWGDGTKNDDFQLKAASNAANFLLHVIELGGWEIN